MSRSLFVHLPSMAGMWADSYITLQSISQAGDSGAPVFLQGTNTLIGHLVGGAPGVISFVQAIEVALKATGATLGMAVKGGRQ